MRKLITIILALAILTSIDCKDFMNSNRIACHLKKSTDSVKVDCHKQKKNSSKKCACPEKKNLSLQESSKKAKDSISFELVFHSPINISYSSEITPNMHLSHFHKKSSLHPQISPTKTIRLLV